ncbi:hypothetical protein LN893_07845 [Pontibacter sp. XAAS-A31]|nr:hypothetical protein [Pontibacter harenae]
MATESTDSLQALQEEPQRISNMLAADSVDFNSAFKRFFIALQSADTTALNSFIPPYLGLWVIEQPGAVPKMTQVYDIAQFKRHFQSRSFLQWQMRYSNAIFRKKAGLLLTVPTWTT